MRTVVQLSILAWVVVVVTIGGAAMLLDIDVNTDVMWLVPIVGLILIVMLDVFGAMWRGER